MSNGDAWRTSPEWESAKTQIADAVVNLRFDDDTDKSLREAERILGLSDEDVRKEIDHFGNDATFAKARALLSASGVISATVTGDEPWTDLARGVLSSRCAEAAERLAMPPFPIRAEPNGLWRRLLRRLGRRR